MSTHGIGTLHKGANKPCLQAGSLVRVFNFEGLSTAGVVSFTSALAIGMFGLVVLGVCLPFGSANFAHKLAIRAID